LSLPNAHSTFKETKVANFKTKERKRDKKEKGTENKKDKSHHNTGFGTMGIKSLLIVGFGVPESDQEPRSERVRSVTVDMVTGTPEPLNRIPVEIAVPSTKVASQGCQIMRGQCNAANVLQDFAVAHAPRKPHITTQKIAAWVNNR
jgi:hypothetical protein